MEIPKDLHPNDSPTDALQVGKLAGYVKAWAQNGVIFDVNLVGGEKQKVHQQDMAQWVSKLILKEEDAKAERAAYRAEKEAEAKKLEAVEKPKPKKKAPAKKKPTKKELEKAAEEVADVIEVVADDEAEAIIAEEVDVVVREATEEEEAAEAELSKEVEDPPVEG